jgi:hypothetical protein
VANFLRPGRVQRCGCAGHLDDAHGTGPDAAVVEVQFYNDRLRERTTEAVTPELARICSRTPSSSRWNQRQRPLHLDVLIDARRPPSRELPIRGCALAGVREARRADPAAGVQLRCARRP